jgi:phosphatidylglycerophosphate synthase
MLHDTELRPAVSIVPDLVLLPSLASLDASEAPVHDRGPTVLGLDLFQRTILAARRAGYGRVFFLARDRYAPPGTTAVSDWDSLADALLPYQSTSLVIAPATVLAETDWLRKLRTMQIEPGAWAATGQGVIVLSPAAVPAALAVLRTGGEPYTIAAVQPRLSTRFGSPCSIPIEIDPMVVTTLKDVRLAERRLLRSLVKETDGFMARHVDRPISLQITRHLALTAIEPTQITMVSMAIGLCGAPFFLSPLWSWQTVGALLFLLHSIVDGCDGELARLKFQESRRGGILDFWTDNIVHVAVFGCMAPGWALSSAAAWPLLLGAAAIFGTIGSAGFVYWRQMRGRDGSFTSVSTTPDDSLARVLDAASRRDFIYLVVMLALFGKSSWFLILASMGAPAYLFLLVFLAARERSQRRPVKSGA